MPADYTPSLGGPDPLVLPGAEAIRPLAAGATWNWRRWVAGGASAVLALGVVWQLRRAGAGDIHAMLGKGAGFWLAFIALYLTQPVSEFVIFSRLWRLPLAGFAALLRKFVSNEILFGYSGEVYLYLWARNRMGLANAPFGAIKDVTITSALVGNAMTLAMLGVSAPALMAGGLGAWSMPILWSGLAVVGLSFVILLFGRKIFSLRMNDLAYVSAVHLVRMLIATVLTGLVWSLALPAVALGTWVVLAAVRLLVSRLPFVTNKDLLFANLAIFLVGGQQHGVGGLLAALAILTLGAHLGVLALLGAGDVVKALRKA